MGDDGVWDAAIKRQNANLIVCMADWVVPGHGAPFRVLAHYRYAAVFSSLLGSTVESPFHDSLSKTVLRGFDSLFGSSLFSSIYEASLTVRRSQTLSPLSLPLDSPLCPESHLHFARQRQGTSRKSEALDQAGIVVHGIHGFTQIRSTF